jgi:serine/threonine-protein kinase
MQEPVAGASASTAAPVAISVAVPGTIPDVSGLALGDAKRILARNGYLIGQIVMLGDGQPGNGKVVRTDPGAGRQLDANESVTIYYRAVAAH